MYFTNRRIKNAANHWTVSNFRICWRENYWRKKQKCGKNPLRNIRNSLKADNNSDFCLNIESFFVVFDMEKIISKETKLHRKIFLLIQYFEVILTQAEWTFQLKYWNENTSKEKKNNWYHSQTIELATIRVSNRCGFKKIKNYENWIDLAKVNVHSNVHLVAIQIFFVERR